MNTTTMNETIETVSAANGPQTIREFAERYRVKRLPAGKPSRLCGNRAIEVNEDVVEGKCGFIGEGWGDGRMIAHLLAAPRNADMNKKLASRTRILEQSGLRLKVRSGCESAWFFDPLDEFQSRAAILAVEPRKRKTYSATTLESLAARLKSQKRALPGKVGPETENYVQGVM